MTQHKRDIAIATSLLCLILLAKLQNAKYTLYEMAILLPYTQATFKQGASKKTAKIKHTPIVAPSIN